MKASLRRFSDARLLFLSGALLVASAVPAAAHANPSRSEVLEAIHRIENPHDTRRPGRCGELGPYQFKRSTWRMHTTIPFAYAVNRQASDTVAIRHYDWIKRGLERNGLAPTAYNIALAWNGGLQAAVEGRSPAAAHDYAERVNNIVQELRAERVAALR